MWNCTTIIGEDMALNFKLKNIGPIGEADIELGDLTIICGENNTGKTYAAYAVFGFLRCWEDILQTILTKEISDGTILCTEYGLDTNGSFSGKINEYLSKIAGIFQSKLQGVFSTRHSFGTSLVVPFVDQETAFSISNVGINATLGSPEGGQHNRLEWHRDSGILTISNRDYPHWEWSAALAINRIVFAPVLPWVHISSSERSGISIFRSELDLARTRRIKAVSEWSAESMESLPDMVERIRLAHTYAMPVEYNIESTRGLDANRAYRSWIWKTKPEIQKSIEDIAGGKYRVDERLGPVFQSIADGNREFLMKEASSSVRALHDLGCYLQYLAMPGQLLIIDEPELNLHPKNQRLMARLIARLVNAGIKVLITTHSDYIIKEFNVLIMMHQSTKYAKRVQRENNYDDEEVLDPTRVRAYTTEVVQPDPNATAENASRRSITLKRSSIEPDMGIEVDTIDDSIADMNRIQDELLYGGD